MQSIHKGTEAMLLPNLLAAVLFVSTLLYVPRPKSSSMYLYALSHTHTPLLPVLPALLSNCLTLSHKVLSETKRSHLHFLRWLLFFGCVSVFPSSFFALTVMMCFVNHSALPVVCLWCLLKSARLDA